MQVVSIPSNDYYTNLNTLSQYDVGVSFILTNDTSSPLFLVNSSTLPAASASARTVVIGQTVILEGNHNPYWIRGNTGPVNLQVVSENIVPFSIVDLPSDVYTSTQEKFRRLRVDVGQTGLYEGREFRLVRKISVTAGTPLVFKFESAVDFILQEQSLSVSTGDIEYYAWRASQGIAGGTFTALPVPPIGKNTSSYFRNYGSGRYESMVDVSSGGTFTPMDMEIYADYDRAKTSGATAQSISVQGGNDSVRYLPAGIYYLALYSLDATSVGRFAIAWEERETVQGLTDFTILTPTTEMATYG